VTRDKRPGQAERIARAIDRCADSICDMQRERERERNGSDASIENTLVSIPPIAIGRINSGFPAPAESILPNNRGVKFRARRERREKGKETMGEQDWLTRLRGFRSALVNIFI